MPRQKVTVIFWNVWFFRQNGRLDNGQQLITRLESLVQQYEPDVFGLNEVLVRQNDKTSMIISYLKSRGYYCHFAAISPIDNTWSVGNLLASRYKPDKVKDHILGPDTQAKRRGYNGYNVKAIEAEIMFDEIRITFWLNYFSSLLPRDWATHRQHRRAYDELVGKISNKNMVIGGDFNETKYMLPWLKLPANLTRKTGTLMRPTWRLNGQKRYVISANYDQLIFNNSANLQLQEFAVLNRWPSDHAPLLGIFRVLNKPSQNTF